MKGATHNLVVRTRTDVALYVLNHKRGHLRDLESSFKVTLAVIADPTVTGQQSFVIDRGEQVHTLEAAKALLAAQAAAAPPPLAEEADDDEETFDVEAESEVETEETEGLSDEVAAGEASGGEAGRTDSAASAAGAGAAAGPARPAKAVRARTREEPMDRRSRNRRSRRRRSRQRTRTRPRTAPRKPAGAPDQDARRTPAAPARTPRRSPPAWRAGGRTRRHRSPTNWRRPAASGGEEAVADFDGVAQSSAARTPAEPAAVLPDTQPATSTRAWSPRGRSSRPGSREHPGDRQAPRGALDRTREGQLRRPNAEPEAGAGRHRRAGSRTSRARPGGHRQPAARGGWWSRRGGRLVVTTLPAGGDGDRHSRRSCNLARTNRQRKAGRCRFWRLCIRLSPRNI